MRAMKDKYPFRDSKDGKKVLEFGINEDISAGFELINDELNITVISRKYDKNGKKEKKEWSVHFKDNTIHIDFTIEYFGTIDIVNGEVVRAMQYADKLNKPMNVFEQITTISALTDNLKIKLSNVDTHILQAYTQKFFKNEVTLPTVVVDTINSYIP